MTPSTLHLATFNTGAPFRRVRGAFSMVEMIVVIILIGVLAAVAIPRMTGTRDRAAAAESESVRQLLSSLGQRLTLSGQVVALQYEPGARRLSLLMHAESGTLSTVGPAAKAGPAWKPMPLVRPVVLASTRLSALIVDGRAVALSSLPGAGGASGGGGGGAPYQLEFQPGRVRPMVTLVLIREDSAGEQSAAYQVDLLSEEPAARLRTIASASAIQPIEIRGEDLDASGRRTSPW